MIELRRAVSDDLLCVFALICELEQCGDEQMELSAFSTVYLRNCTDDNVFYLLARDDGQAIGFGSVHFQRLLHHCDQVAEVQELVVTKDAQGRGTGALLLDALQNEACRRGCCQIELCCNMKRVSANEFYGRRGFLKTHYKHTKKFR